MAKNYDLSKMKRVPGPKIDFPNAKIPISIRIDGAVYLWASSESEKLGMGYQTFLNMKLRELANAAAAAKPKKKTKAG